MTDKLARGQAAEALLSNELFRETLNQLDDAYTAAWRQAKTVEAREDCYRYVKLVEKLITDIQSVSTSGQLEQARLKELERGKKGILTWPTNF